MKETINKFFTERPAVSIKGIADEVGVTRQYLDYIRKGTHSPGKDVSKRLYDVFQKYGWKEG